MDIHYLIRMAEGDLAAMSDFGFSKLAHARPVAEAFVHALGLPGKAWRSNTRVWSRLVETARAIWGDRWAIQYLAVLAAGIRSREDRGVDYLLGDSHAPLCERTRYARLRSGDVDWWMAQLEADLDSQLTLPLFAISTWASPKLLIDLGQKLSTRLERLSPEDWRRLRDAVSDIREITEQRTVSLELTSRKGELKKLSPRLIVLLAARLSPRNRRTLLRNCLMQYTGDDQQVLSEMADFSLSEATNKSDKWDNALKWIRRAYEAGANPCNRLFMIHDSQQVPMDDDTIDKVLGSPEQYPLALISIAEQKRTSSISGGAIPVGQVAASEGWF